MMAEPIPKRDSSLKLFKRHGHKSKHYDQSESYSKQSAGLLKPTKPTLSEQPDPTAVTEKGADGALKEFTDTRSIWARLPICLPCKREKLIVRNLLFCH